MADSKPVDPNVAKARKPWTSVTIFGIVLILVFIFLHLPKREAAADGSTSKAPTIDPYSRIFTLNDVDWQGEDNLDPARRIHTHTIDKEMFTLTRLDRDDHLVFTNYPASWKEGTTNYLPDCSYLEMKVMPGQTKRTAMCIFKKELR